jgi:hypothetical protein
VVGSEWVTAQHERRMQLPVSKYRLDRSGDSSCSSDEETVGAALTDADATTTTGTSHVTTAVSGKGLWRRVHHVHRDPGTKWVKDPTVVLDAPPDGWDQEASVCTC